MPRTLREEPDMRALVAAAQLVARVLGLGSPPEDELVALFDRILLRAQPEGKDAWACFRAGILIDVETRNLVMAHLETWFERHEGRRCSFVEGLSAEHVEQFDLALFGQPATEVAIYAHSPSEI